MTVTEIAQLLGVSKATVSRVLNNKPGVGDQTRQRVKKFIDELTEKPIDSFLLNKASTIGLIIPDISNPFFSELARSIGEQCKRYGYTLILGNTDFSSAVECDYIRQFISIHVSGIILVSSSRVALPGHELLKKYMIPCLLLDRRVDGICRFADILCDNKYATYSCCELLIQNESPSIAFLSGGNDVSTSSDRFEGYKAALHDYGIPFNEDLVLDGEYTFESGYNSIIKLEKACVKYSAVLAANDLIALGAMKALKEFGYSIPNDIQIIGFDNIIFSSYMYPPLSTVQQPVLEMGKQAVTLMAEHLELSESERQNKTADFKTIELQPKLLQRGTTLNKSYG